MTSEELTKILEQHNRYLVGDPDGVRANLSKADLVGEDLTGEILIKADFREANLSLANLRGADLREADLSWAGLRGADLRRANLKGADLEGADLKEADLRNADLIGANLSEADLRWADLRGANLDYSVLPLWCGSLSAHFDDRQLKQIAYHLVKAGLQSKNASPETKAELRKIIDFANGFHRVDECGIIVKEEEEKADD